MDLQPGRDHRRGLAALYEITGDGGIWGGGRLIAAAVLGDLTPGGPPAEPGEAGAGRGGDQPQFKGIFVRFLHDFYPHSRQAAYGGFILANARSLWNHARNAPGQPSPPHLGPPHLGPPHFGLHWACPFDQPSPARQASALDALIAAAALAPARPPFDLPALPS